VTDITEKDIPKRSRGNQTPETAGTRSCKVQTSADRKRTNLTNAGKGRKKGVPNRVGATLREVVARFVENNAQGAQALYDRVAAKHPAKALELLARFAEFVLPKQREISGTLATFHFDANAPVSDVAEQQRILAQVFADPNYPMESVPQFASLALPAAPVDAVEAIIEQPFEHAAPPVDRAEPVLPDSLAERIAPIAADTSTWAKLADEPAPITPPKVSVLEQRKREHAEANEQERLRQREAGRIRAAKMSGQL
jgi:hypothetical protein